MTSSKPETDNYEEIFGQHKREIVPMKENVYKSRFNFLNRDLSGLKASEFLSQQDLKETSTPSKKFLASGQIATDETEGSSNIETDEENKEYPVTEDVFKIDGEYCGEFIYESQYKKIVDEINSKRINRHVPNIWINE